jgi:two-component system sensor histidine kinase CpxA
MRRRLPPVTIAAKVLLLAALNLGLLCALFVLFLRFSLRLDLDSFLLAPVQDRVLSVTRQLALELNGTERGGWDSVLATAGRHYGIEFWLADHDGAVLAGPSRSLPAMIAREIDERAEHRRRRPPPQLGQEDQEHHRKPEGPGAQHRRPGRIDSDRPRIFSRHTVDPSRLWFGVLIPLPQLPEKEATLVAGTSSGLLLFDPRPWAAVGAAVILVSVLCWLPFVHGLTKSISHVTRATSQIAEGQFEIELPVRRRDELGRLSASIKRMAERLASFIQGQKRFLGDTAHELCSPLARIQVALGILERSAIPEQQRPLADLREDVQQMSALVNEVLMFSKAALKGDGAPLAAVSLAAVVSRVVEREAAQGVRVEARVDGSLRALAQSELLARAVSNVVRNAIRHAGSAGPIGISAEQEGGEVVLRVSDCGPGIPEEQLEAVFEPFYRLDASRERGTGGVGLGLTIVKTCVEACQGRVRCRNRKPSGLEVEMRLKGAPPEIEEDRSGAGPSAATKV